MAPLAEDIQPVYKLQLCVFSGIVNLIPVVSILPYRKGGYMESVTLRLSNLLYLKIRVLHTEAPLSVLAANQLHLPFNYLCLLCFSVLSYVDSQRYRRVTVVVSVCFGRVS